ncbi:MAG: hypothetical protein HKN37_14225 [Rhodothermales bacterium]|nr:hypothetical protein [Rhodothermales bacterium]
MTLLIEHDPDDPDKVIRLCGEVAGPEVEELESFLHRAALSVKLDVSEVTQVDERGLTLLRRARADGAHVIGCSPYLRLRLEDK